MSSSEKNAFEDQYLVRYLLGNLPREEAERLDELSITDDDVSWRLRAVENDLVDAYVRSELDGETLRQFNAFYLSSSRRRQKAEFAEGLRRFQDRSASAAEPVKQSVPTGFSLWHIFRTPRSALQFGIAMTAVILFIAGYLLFDNVRLRREVNEARAQQGTIDQRTQQLEKELSTQRATNTEAQKRLEQQSTPAELKTVSLLLPPPTRGLSLPKTVTVHGDTDLLLLQLMLEFADFSTYRVTLKDPATNRVVWRSAELQPVSASERKTLAIGVPATLVKQQNYIAEVAGMQSGKSAQPPQTIGDYPFHVVLR